MAYERGDPIDLHRKRRPPRWILRQRPKTVTAWKYPLKYSKREVGVIVLMTPCAIAEGISI
jgi:hypothetical protein